MSVIILVLGSSTNLADAPEVSPPPPFRELSDVSSTNTVDNCSQFPYDDDDNEWL